MNSELEKRLCEGQAVYPDVKTAAECEDFQAIEFTDPLHGSIIHVRWYPRHKGDNYPIEATYISRYGSKKTDRWFANGHYTSLRNPGGFALKLKEGWAEQEKSSDKSN